MDKQKVIVVLLLITIVFSIASIILTVGVDISNIGKTKIIKYSAPSQGSVSLNLLPSPNGGNSP